MADWTPTEIAANEAGKYYSIKLNGLAGIEAFKIIFYPNANTGTFYLDDVQIKENIITPVSYTHLDVYKRQPQHRAWDFCRRYAIGEINVYEFR